MVRVALGLDLGTSAAKALALDESGRVRARGAAAYPTHAPEPGVVEHDPRDWWRAACAALRRCLEAAETPLEPAALGFSGHMSAVAPLDRRGRPLRRALTIADARGAEEAARLEARFGDAIAAATGNAPLTAFALPKWLWLQRHEPELFARAARLLGAKDYLRLRATGTVGSEPSEAGNTLLLDLRRRRWNRSLLEALELPPKLLPPLGESLAWAGELTPEAAAELGLPAGLPCIAGLADMAASVLGSGLARDDQLAVTLGTSGQLTRLVEAPDPALLGSFTYHPHALPGRAYAMASILGGGLALQWFAGVLASLSDDDEARALERLVAAAADAPPGARGVLFVPHLVGRGSPGFDPQRSAAFLHLARAHRGGDLARAVLEGVAFSVRQCLEELERAHGAAGELRLGGGGARGRLWRTILADALQRPLHPLAERDAGPLGTAWAVAHALGWAPELPAAVATGVRLRAPQPPDAAAAAAYDDAYARFLAHA